jgi:hypothetical protein
MRMLLRVAAVPYIYILITPNLARAVSDTNGFAVFVITGRSFIEFFVGK